MTIAALLQRQVPPKPESLEHDVLISFTAFQLVRTLAARADATSMSEAFHTAVFDGPGPADAQITRDEALAIMLGAGPEMFKAMRDLSIALVRSDAHQFVASDNPAFKYNTYCEGVDHFGVTGAKSRGLQVFLPLGPQVLLLLYDASVYKIGSWRNRKVVSATYEDVRTLNKMQFMSAQENVYFGNWSMVTSCHDLADSVAILKATAGPKVIKAYNTADERDVLLHQFWPMPQLEVQLSFVRIRRNARRVELFDRGQLLRDGRKTKGGPPSANSISFEVRNARAQ